MSAKRACVIGAGCCGITAAKTLKEAGIHVDCFEMSDRVGGNWAYENPNGVSAAYRSLHINTSKRLMQYSDFPMPSEWPPYLHHSLVFKYLNDYVDHFGVREHIRFNTQVKSVRREAGEWVVTLGDDTRHTYDAVFVANGHHWKERWPSFKVVDFTGKQMHSHAYRSPAGLEDKNVLVVGMGSSGVDIAGEACRVAANTWLSARRGVHIIPKFVGGKPIDEILTRSQLAVLTRLPFPVMRWYVAKRLERYRGKMSDWGLPEPDHKLFDGHATASEEFLSLVQHGRIKIKPDIEELRGEHVSFRDGTKERIDVVIYATGYDISFPFFDSEIIDPKDNVVRLYRHVVHPRFPGLYFIGLIQVSAAVMPLAELQAVWIAKVMTGAAALPSPEGMEQGIRQDAAKAAKRYVQTSRHTIEVDPFHYQRVVETEIRRGVAASRSAR